MKHGALVYFKGAGWGLAVRMFAGAGFANVDDEGVCWLWFWLAWGFWMIWSAFKYYSKNNKMKFGSVCDWTDNKFKFEKLGSLE
jgi:hypothetical protein